jgi:hypothetical protein
VRDGNITYAIQLSPAESNQGAYAGIDPDDVLVTNQDNEKDAREKPAKGLTVDAVTEQESSQVVDAFLAEFGPGDDFGNLMELNWDLRGRARVAAEFDTVLEAYHAHDDPLADARSIATELLLMNQKGLAE